MDGRGGVSSPDLSVQSRWRWLWALWECVSAHALPASESLVYQRPISGAPGGRVGLRGLWKRDSGCGSAATSAPSRRRAAQRHFTASRLRARACDGSTISKPFTASARAELSAGCCARLLALVVGFVGVLSSASTAACRVFVPHATRFRRVARPRLVSGELEWGRAWRARTLLPLLPPLGGAATQAAPAAARVYGLWGRALGVSSPPVTTRLVVEAPCVAAWRGWFLVGGEQTVTAARERAFVDSSPQEPAGQTRALGCAPAGEG